MVQAPKNKTLLRPPIKQARPIQNQPQKMYKPSQALLDVVEEPLDYMIQCPFCKKRTMDVSELPERAVRLRFKCPHCRRLVNMPLVMAADGAAIATVY